ncbi:methyltransferase domain-containing protein [Pontiella agarivorans]|uniref:Methyltransferase domain-containing protein n=1 Tax=Pontiella agarivorans TaxID=3038953 RepID=A0ABU5MVU6_9BACT|nr:methyltransferase domain-containing protein [Pontiella agarivorans]MDZ8118247.1 methyltransferase domain-containing protein [Pontiella agarivorans]
MKLEAANTILYCKHWPETVAFYRHQIGLQEKGSTDWMVEFFLTPTACLSVADASRTSILPNLGKGITLTFKVFDLHAVWQQLKDRNIAVDPIRNCTMGGEAFFLRDPEGNRLEFWADSPWSDPEMVARLSSTPPNSVLMRFAEKELQCKTGNRLLDIGCGAGCNAVPLAKAGWTVLGLDFSESMLAAARRRADDGGLTEQLQLEPAPMDRLPVEDEGFDFIVAHGVWNLARSAAEFRTAVREAARSAKSGAPLFIYTFSRSTLPPEAEPIKGEPFIFTGLSGKPACFLTEEQLIRELAEAGFVQETPVTEYGATPGGKPAILEGIFRRQ